MHIIYYIFIFFFQEIAYFKKKKYLCKQVRYSSYRTDNFSKLKTEFI